MKILQISSAQTLGGGERHLADLANGLASRGHDVHVVLRRESALKDELSGVRPEHVTTLPLRNSLDAKSARDLSRLVKRNGIEIVHAHMARDYPLAAYAAGTNPGSKLIITRHVLFRLSRLHRITLSKSARVIAVSQAVASQLRADGVVAPEKISVILNGIDTDRFRIARDNFARPKFLSSWRLPENSLLVGIVGELTPLKGQEDFLRAAVQVLRQQPAAYFIIAGLDHSPGNKHRTYIEQLIEDLDLSQRVRLVGWVEDLAQLYCALDVFVSASHTESFGLAIAEAMASGTAVVATETEGARELIQTGQTGLLVPISDVNELADAVLTLLKDRDRKTCLAAAAQKAAAANFSVERMIAETEALYQAEIQGTHRNQVIEK